MSELKVRGSIRRIHKIGGSYLIVIPHKLVKKFNIKAGDFADVINSNNTIIIRPIKIVEEKYNHNKKRGILDG